MREPNYKCQYCGKLEYKVPWRLKRYKNNFCSTQCSANFRNKKQQVVCEYCSVSFIKANDQVIRYPVHFCSKNCQNLYRRRKEEVSCVVCSKTFMKHLKDIKRTPRHCCSQECAKILRKFHKDWGSRRSKLEIELEAEMKKTYSFEMIFNDTHIGYELDVEIPCLDFAIEINGIFHYKAIYGIEKLLQVQKTDREKLQKCIELDINLVVINVSEDKNSKKVRDQRIREIISLIDNRIKEFSYKPAIKQLVMEF